MYNFLSVLICENGCAEFATGQGRKWCIYSMPEKENNPLAKKEKNNTVTEMKGFTTL